MTLTLSRRSLALGAAALAAPSIARAQTQMAIATGTTGGVYYPLGGGMANILSRSIPGLSATVEVTGGSVGNLQLLGAGRVGMGFSQVDAAVNAYEGDDRFRGKPIAIRTLAVLYTNRMQVVTTGATGITSVASLKGKRISTGAPGSATEGMALRLIEAADLDINKSFRARQRLSPAESTSAIKDGKLDAYFFVSGILPRLKIDKESFSQAFLQLNRRTFLPDRIFLLAPLTQGGVELNGPVAFRLHDLLRILLGERREPLVLALGHRDYPPGLWCRKASGTCGRSSLEGATGEAE